jgi:hypothetical protein
VIDFARDLDTVFFAPPFAHRFARQRPSVADLPVMLIVGLEDVEALDARAIAARRTAHFAAGQDVRVDDLLVALEAVSREIPAGSVFKVLEPPRRINDGMEAEALLGSVRP